MTSPQIEYVKVIGYVLCRNTIHLDDGMCAGPHKSLYEVTVT